MSWVPYRIRMVNGEGAVVLSWKSRRAHMEEIGWREESRSPHLFPPLPLSSSSLFRDTHVYSKSEK